MESNSFGVLAEGTLVLRDGCWYIVPEEGDAVPVNSLLEKWADRKIRFVLANMEIMSSIAPGTEVSAVQGMTNQEISERLKRR